MKPRKKRQKRLERRQAAMRATWENIRKSTKAGDPQKAYRMPGSMNK